MKTFAAINNQIVVNCIVADSLENAEQVTGLECVEYDINSTQVEIGCTYIDETFTNPNASEPTPPVPLPE